jgi:hypothetical protein
MLVCKEWRELIESEQELWQCFYRAFPHGEIVPRVCHTAVVHKDKM